MSSGQRRGVHLVMYFTYLVNAGYGEDSVPHGGLLHAGLGHHAGPKLIARKAGESRGNDMIVKVKGATVLGIPARRNCREDGFLS